MEEKEKRAMAAAAQEAKRHEMQTQAEERLPGQQTGHYGNAAEKDVRQMTCMLNNPEDKSQESRG